MYCHGDFEDLIKSLTHSNDELLKTVDYIEEDQAKYSDIWFEGIDDLKKQIGKLIFSNRRLVLQQGLDAKGSLHILLDTFMTANFTESDISDIMTEENMENQRSNSVQSAEERNFVAQKQSELSEKKTESNQTEKENENYERTLAKQVPKEDLEAVENELQEVKEKLKDVTEEKVKLREDLDYLTDQYSKQDNIQRMHIEKIEQENKQYLNLILEYQSGEHGRTREYDNILMQIERERTEKLVSINEQKALRQQLENLSKTMKSMQIKNEELLRFQCNQDDQVDDFKRLKQHFQENGLPSIEQFIALQRQNEAYREELLNERKEKERLLSIKEKLRRDLDSLQSRISSLQEQVYKYREHIFYLQQRTGKDGSTSPVPPSPLLENPPPSPLTPSPSPSFHNPSRLYGNNAPQYINESLLQGNVPPRFPLYAVSEPGKKPGTPHSKHGLEGQATGKSQWPYQQQNFQGKLGRHLSLDGNEWKRGGNSPQNWSTPTDNIFNSSSSGRHNSSNSYSSPRSSSSLSGSSEEGVDGLDKQNPQFDRKRVPRNPDDYKQMQNFGPNPYEGWPRQNSTGIRMNQNFQQRNPRRYSSPVGNGMRSPPDYWAPQMPASKPWHSPLEQTQLQDTSSSGLRQCSDPWQQSIHSNIPKSSQVSTATSSHGESGTYVNSGGFGSR
ncbi:intracellular protein transport protein USO1 isoform X2 [Exaiptasia diaphana]|uniref:Uncharacterized protein n=1 Tax=Exaiptasia diaphana TaxID=2652724 RepID=A0A913X149_EXADI|nr:intracellular protein transport protein USO1 isoform X2 [Exaiptasia diaphana]